MGVTNETRTIITVASLELKIRKVVFSVTATITRDRVRQGHVTMSVSFRISRSNDARAMIVFVMQVFKVKDVKKVEFHTVTIMRDLIRQGHVTLNITSLISSSSEAGVMIFLVSLVTLMKKHRSGFSGTSDEENHAQFHMILIYKVTRDSYSVELYLFETLDPENLPNKKRIIVLASLERELGKVTLRIT